MKIDQMVYILCDLAEEEIRAVENNHDWQYSN